MNTPRPHGLETGGKFASPAASIRSLSRLLEDDGHTPLASAFLSRPANRTAATAARGAAKQHLQGLLASKESETALLRQQLAQLTADFKFNLKLLEERDAELERVDTVVVGLRETAAMREAALQEARCALGGREAALRDKEARVAALEERQKQVVELCERQVADARASRDEEVARCQQDVLLAQSEAAKGKAEVIAGYERQVSAAAASEREARQRAVAATEEAEHVRNQLQCAEARIAEQELAMQRMVVQFEGALATLQQLEVQYDGLAADTGAADALRTARIADLEQEVEGLRTSQAALVQEHDASVAQLLAALEQAEAAATEAKQQYHQAMMDAAELTEALAEERQEAAQQRGRAQAAEEAGAEARATAAAVQASLEQEAAATARTSSLLEAARLHQDMARRDAQEQEQLAAQLREAAAVLEAERNDYAKATEVAEAKVQAAEERAQLLASQVEEERRLHTQLLESREAEVVARWERAVEAAKGEGATLQQALDLANRQLQAAHRDTETLRLQVQHLRLAAGVAAPLPPLHSSGTGGSILTSPAGYAGSTRSGGWQHAVDAPGCRLAVAAAGSVGALEELEDSLAETASPAASRDVFSELPVDHYPTASSQRQLQQQQQSRRPTANAYQQQLHHHIDTLAGKLSTFQRAVDEARLVGQQASQQLAESSSMLPTDLKRRQEAAADQQLQQALAAERQQFERERQRLDQQLAEQQQLLREREIELQCLQRAEDEKRRQERERQRQPEEQQEVEGRQRQLQELEAAAAGYPIASLSNRPGHPAPLEVVQLDMLAGDSNRQRRSKATASMQLPVLGATLARSSSLGRGSYGSLLLPGRLLTAPAAAVQRRSVSAALAAACSSSSPPPPSQGHQNTSSYRSTLTESEVPWPLPRINGLTMAGAGGTDRPLAPRAAVGGQQQQPGATGAVTVGGEDPLARARRQVLVAKQYLKSVAELGSGQPTYGNG